MAADQDSQAAFEVFQREGHDPETGDMLLMRRSDGKYVNNHTQQRWVYWQRAIAWASARQAERERRLATAESIANDQANDRELWSLTVTDREARLQRALRKLAAAIEGTDDYGAPLAFNAAERENRG